MISIKKQVRWYARATLHRPGRETSGTLLSCVVLWDGLKPAERAKAAISLSDGAVFGSFDARDLAALVCTPEYLAIR